jgi:hypothetical protein
MKYILMMNAGRQSSEEPSAKILLGSSEILPNWCRRGNSKSTITSGT